VARHYKEPSWFTKHVFNPVVEGMTRLGVSVWGSRTLAVRGRKSGEWRTTPVNLLTFDGKEYLVAPRGETEWVRNMRVAHGGELRLGKKVQPFSAVEVDDDAKVPLLRAYLKRWKMETGQFFDGVGADATDEELRAIAPKHPAFEVRPPA
jgi:deazaflavin-dependent oxidoreductase (nitroreductase family)